MKCSYDTKTCVLNVGSNPASYFKSVRLKKNCTCAIIRYQLSFLPEYLFFNFTALVHVSLPPSVQEIGIGVFANCCSLKSIKLPPNLQEIRSSAFSNTGLESIDIPGSVTRISATAFYNCRRLRRIEFAKDGNLGFIGVGAFEGCGELSTTTIPCNQISYKAFALCKSLRDVEIVGDAVKIGDLAFEGCSNLRKLAIDSCAELGNKSFARCGLVDVDIKVSNWVSDDMYQGKNQFTGNDDLKIVTVRRNIDNFRGAFPKIDFHNKDCFLENPEAVPITDHILASWLEKTKMQTTDAYYVQLTTLSGDKHNIYLNTMSQGTLSALKKEVQKRVHTPDFILLGSTIWFQ